MTGAERQVLKIVKELILASEEAIGRKIFVSLGFSKYIKEMCRHLVKEGHLLRTPKGYKITSKGKNAISPAKNI